MSCCSEIVSIDGCFDACQTIDIGYDADSTGIHYIEVVLPLGARQLEAVSLTSGDDIVIPAGRLNESGVHDIRVKKPDGTYYVFATGITCAQVTTFPSTRYGIVT